jgi:predicted dehydrogenase
MHMKEQIEAGFVGEVLSVHVSLLRDGVLSRPSHRTWQRDVELGANTLTIAAGHTVDAMCFVAGDFTRLSAVVATQAKQWLDTGTGKPLGFMGRSWTTSSRHCLSRSGSLWPRLAHRQENPAMSVRCTRYSLKPSLKSSTDLRDRGRPASSDRRR